jgi:hypothetical protein
MVVKVCTLQRHCALLSALQLDVGQVQYFLTRLLALRRSVQKSNIGAVIIARADCKPRNPIFFFLYKEKAQAIQNQSIEKSHLFKLQLVIEKRAC